MGRLYGCSYNSIVCLYVQRKYQDGGDAYIYKVACWKFYIHIYNSKKVYAIWRKRSCQATTR